MSPRHRRGKGDADGERAPEYTTEEIDKLTARADELLGQLHEVLGEMSRHLQSVAIGEDET